MTRTRIISLGIMFLLIAGACGGTTYQSIAAGGGKTGSDQTGHSNPFGDTEWILMQATVDGVQLLLLDRYPVTLQRNGGDVDGSAACNSYFGTIVDGDLLFEGFGATEMACDPAPMTLEFDYLDALGRVDSARGGTELLLTGDGVELRFSQVRPTPDSAIQGTDWVLDTLIEGDAASSTVNGSAANLRFDARTMSGNDSCNTFQGDYEIDGGTLRPGLLSVTARGCEDAIMRQAQRVGAVLGTHPILEVSGDRLSLLTADGLGLIYRAA